MEIKGPTDGRVGNKTKEKAETLQPKSNKIKMPMKMFKACDVVTIILAKICLF